MICPKCNHVHTNTGWNIGASESYVTCRYPTSRFGVCACRYGEPTITHGDNIQ